MRRAFLPILRALNSVAYNGVSPLSLARLRWTMARRSKREKEQEVWINPKFSLKGANGDRDFDHRHRLGDAEVSRILELADIALGLKKPPQKAKRHIATGVKEPKIHPYST